MARRLGIVCLVLSFGLMVLAACSTTAGSGTPVDTVASSPMGNALSASGPSLMKVDRDAGPAARGATAITSDVAGVCLTPQEAELGRLINEYRAQVGLPAVQLSKSLTLVAQQHAWDSVNNSNAWPAPPAGQECNMHSWSGNVNPALQQGTWTAVCYTDDHANMAGMHRKPREIAGYPADGYENSHWASNGATAAGALRGWQNSPGHNAVITEQNGWGPFLALGVGISGNYAHMWVGEVADPAGAPPICGGGAAAAPTNVPPTVAPAPAEPTTAAPAPAVPTTAAPNTAGGATGEIMNAAGTIAREAIAHTFEIAQGRRYAVVVTPSNTFDVALAYTCQVGNGSQSATIDSGWEGEAETYTYIAPGNGTCTVSVSGYDGSTGDYTIRVVAE